MPVQKAGDGNFELELWCALWPMGLLFLHCNVIYMQSNITSCGVEELEIQTP